ncbi:MAG: hypothetical protein ACLP1X_03330 [Polyangiaceae bacterium]
MRSPERGLYVTFGALSALALLLGTLLVRPAELRPVRGAPPFDLDEPPPAASSAIVAPGR